MKTFQFRIQIRDIQKPPVWRRILISSEATFDDLHNVIQAVFGWGNCHLYQFSEQGWRSDKRFEIPDTEYNDADITDSRLIRLNKVFTKAKQKFTYIYDFGDNWYHHILLEEILDEKIIRPVCIDGKGACPPEDCGGIPGYNNLVDILSDLKHPDYKEMIKWLGMAKNTIWDVNAFDKAIANERCSKIIL